MPHANEHDQPVEGGRESIEHTLKKQEERDRKAQQKSKTDNNPADQSKTQSKPNAR